MDNSTVAKRTNQEPITIESLEKIWEEANIVPVIFKPTKEIVYTTPQVANYIAQYNTAHGTQKK